MTTLLRKGYGQENLAPSPVPAAETCPRKLELRTQRTTVRFINLMTKPITDMRPTKDHPWSEWHQVLFE